MPKRFQFYPFDAIFTIYRDDIAQPLHVFAGHEVDIFDHLGGDGSENWLIKCEWLLVCFFKGKGVFYAGNEVKFGPNKLDCYVKNRSTGITECSYVDHWPHGKAAGWGEPVKLARVRRGMTQVPRRNPHRSVTTAASKVVLDI